MDKALKEQLKSSLLEEKEKLTQELKGIAKPDPNMKGNWIAEYPKFEEESSGSSSSLEEEQDEIEEYEVRLETEHSLESSLLSVTKALERMENGTYGVCPTCKESISLERLKANPAAEFDIGHEPKNNSL